MTSDTIRLLRKVTWGSQVEWLLTKKLTEKKTYCKYCWYEI